MTIVTVLQFGLLQSAVVIVLLAFSVVSISQVSPCDGVSVVLPATAHSFPPSTVAVDAVQHAHFPISTAPFPAHRRNF